MLRSLPKFLVKLAQESARYMTSELKNINISAAVGIQEMEETIAERIRGKNGQESQTQKRRKHLILQGTWKKYYQKRIVKRDR